MKMLLIKKEILEERIKKLEESQDKKPNAVNNYYNMGQIDLCKDLQSQANEVEIVDIQEERVRWSDNKDFGGTFADWLEWNKLIITIGKVEAIANEYADKNRMVGF